MVDASENEHDGYLVPPQHDIPNSELYKMEFGDIPPELKQFDESIKLLPLEKYGDGQFKYAVQIGETKERYICYLFSSGADLYGWCRCSIFGKAHVCPHLYVAFRWSRGVLQVDNEETAREARDTLNEG